MLKHRIPFLLLIFIFISCKTENKTNQENIDQVIEEEKKAMSMQSETTTEDISLLIASIPPPIEMSTLILNQEVNYDNKLLHDINSIKNYNDSYSLAFNLGVYGTDLGYTHLYEQTSDGIVYFDCINKLAIELKIEKYFDPKLISKLTRNNNLDSILSLTTHNFSQINDHFIDEKTPQLSASLIAGGWIESLYLLSNSYNMKQSDELKNKIGEQKISLKLLSEMLHKYDEDPKIKKISVQFDQLSKTFENVEITEKKLKNTNKEPVFKDDGTMTFSSSKETIVNVDKESLNNIISTVLSVRNTLIL